MEDCLKGPAAPLLAPFRPLGWIAALGEVLVGAPCDPEFRQVMEAVRRWREAFWRGEEDLPDAPEEEYPRLFARAAIQKAAEAAAKAGMLAVYVVDGAGGLMAAFRGPAKVVEVVPPTTGAFVERLVELGLGRPRAILPTFEEAEEMAKRMPRAVAIELEDGRGAVFAY